MKLTMTSILTNTTNTMDLPINATEFANGLIRRDGGDLIQDAFPQLNADQREFIMTGITAVEWDSMSDDED
jgi:hypothetical protein